MAGRMTVALQATLFVLAAVLYQGEALRCWHCSSDSSPDCGDVITYSEHNRQFHTADCEADLRQNPYTFARPVCKKIVEIKNGARIVIRKCDSPLPDERDITDGVCSTVPSPSHVTVESCHVCTTDLCNGAHSALGHASVMTSLLFFGIPSILFAYRWSY
ncbi:UPAR/Ly6 domain-containing protein CG9338 [Neodiprion pinetum]|uniref:Uncharacterized protein LOC107223369 n=1 Tax=Neodiprion lecontei TaxID=441921 RepID=A0A6J0BWB9_NEOLC|nr:uncharacterized protein LOC107223369 [Neodiprion lecontei]XP_046492554.1 uncharacterized protein LOC124224479 [Neodiprion pinetum]